MCLGPPAYCHSPKIVKVRSRKWIFSMLNGSAPSNHQTTRYSMLYLEVWHLRNNTLVFAEVKLRRGPEYGDPLEGRGRPQEVRHPSLAEQYLAEREPGFEGVRFDVVGILAGRRNPRVTHVRDAF